MISIARNFVFFMVFFFGVSTGNSEGVLDNHPNTTPAELLRKYQSWLEVCSAVEYTFVEEFSACKLNGDAIKGQTSSQSGTMRVDKKNKSFFIVQKENSGHRFISEEQIVSVENSKFISAVLEGEEMEGRDTVYGDYSVVSYLDVTKKDHKFEEDLSARGGNSALIFGVFSVGIKYIANNIEESFAQMRLDCDQQNWQSHNVYRLVGVDGKDRYELWLDPTLGYMPVRISFSRDPSIARSSADYFAFDFCVQSCHQTDDKIFIPQKYTIAIDGSHQWYEKNTVKSIPSKETIQGEINVISLGNSFSDKDFQLTTPIPDYTEVYMQDAPQIKYVWIDGKIEPLTDALAEERLRGHGFTPGTSSQWFSLIVGTAGFLMIVISIGIQIWKKLKKNKDNKKDEDK